MSRDHSLNLSPREIELTRRVIELKMANDALHEEVLQLRGLRKNRLPALFKPKEKDESLYREN